jgi:hypothetical protein
LDLKNLKRRDRNRWAPSRNRKLKLKVSYPMRNPSDFQSGDASVLLAVEPGAGAKPGLEEAGALPGSKIFLNDCDPVVSLRSTTG